MAANPFGVIDRLLDRERELGEFIRDGPSTGLPGYVRDKYRHRCNEFANLPPWARLLTGGAGGSVGRICTPYWDDNGWDGPEPLVPAPGGQCAGVNYRVVATFRNPVTGAVTGVDDRVLQGPIEVRVEGTQPGDPGVACSQPGQKYFGGRALYAAGRGVYTWDGVCGTVSGLASLQITRQDGNPDDCGNQRPIIVPGPNPPPNPGPLPGPEPTTDPRNPTGVPLFPVPPYIDPIGGPVPIEDPGDGGDGGGGGGGGGAPPGDVGDPGVPEDTGQGGEAGGEAADGDVLTGLRINFAAPPVGGNEYAEGIYRGVCYIYMGTPDGLDHDPAGAMLRDGQFVFAEKDNLTMWFVSANMGYSLRVTPYYRPAEGEG